jgi:hypothetical protein
MTQDEYELTKANYEDAIAKLVAYRSHEPDQAKRDEASAKIDALHDKIEDLAWRNMTSRTEALNGLIADLKFITDRASNVPQLSNALKDLRGASDRAKELAGGKDVKCKTAGCGVKVFYLPNALAAVAAVGGKKKITLICRNLHSNEYEVPAA